MRGFLISFLVTMVAGCAILSPQDNQRLNLQLAKIDPNTYYSEKYNFSVSIPKHNNKSLLDITVSDKVDNTLYVKFGHESSSNVVYFVKLVNKKELFIKDKFNLDNASSVIKEQLSLKNNEPMTKSTITNDASPDLNNIIAERHYKQRKPAKIVNGNLVQSGHFYHVAYAVVDNNRLAIVWVKTSCDDDLEHCFSRNNDRQIINMINSIRFY